MRLSRLQERVAKYLATHIFPASEAVSIAAQARTLEYLIEAEEKYVKIIERTVKAGLVPRETIVKLRTTEAEINALLKKRAGTWAREVVPEAYGIGRETVAAPLRVLAAVEPQVRQKELVFQNMRWDAAAGKLMIGEREAVGAYFRDWNRETADWLSGEFASARHEGLKIGNLTDIGDEQTLVGRLLKEPGRLRGYTFTGPSGKTIHISAEQKALHLARIETVRVENQAAVEEAKVLGLDSCYNANPDDVNTTWVCKAATDGGIMTLDEMKEKHGVPPRLDILYHLCRSKLIFLDPDWVTA